MFSIDFRCSIVFFYNPSLAKDSRRWNPGTCKALHGIRFVSASWHLPAKQDSGLSAGKEERKKEKRGRSQEDFREMKVRKPEATPPQLRCSMSHSPSPQPSPIKTSSRINLCKSHLHDNEVVVFQNKMLLSTCIFGPVGGWKVVLPNLFCWFLKRG